MRLPMASLQLGGGALAALCAALQRHRRAASHSRTMNPARIAPVQASARTSSHRGNSMCR